jgi:hypothetical protein
MKELIRRRIKINRDINCSDSSGFSEFEMYREGLMLRKS